MKKLTRSKLIKKLDSLFSKYIRRKDAIDEVAKCVTCGVERHWKERYNVDTSKAEHITLLDGMS